MRLNDLSDGSIKALLILGLLFANIGVVVSQRGVDLHGSSRVARAPSAVREARALPDGPQP